MDFPEADADMIATIPSSVIRPTYRSGFRYSAGLQKTYFVSGRLLDAGGKPLGFVPGDIVDSKGEKRDVTFTDEDGTFQMYGLVPGEYVIEWPESVGKSKISVTDASGAYVDIGDISPEKDGGSK